MRKMMFLVFLISVTPAFAQAPIPDGLLKAKVAYQPGRFYCQSSGPNGVNAGSEFRDRLFCEISALDSIADVMRQALDSI